MTNKLNPDHNTPKTNFLPFAAGELDSSGLRLTRAEFSRFMDVSKQAVGEWVTSGKITLGADNRLDPRQAVSQLLRNSDPARLRSKVLAPLMRDIGGLQKRIVDLEVTLMAANENASFHEASAMELIGQLDSLGHHLSEEHDTLSLLSANKVIASIMEWLKRIADGDSATGLTILDCMSDHDEDRFENLSATAPEQNKGGNGDE